MIIVTIDPACPQSFELPVGTEVSLVLAAPYGSTADKPIPAKVTTGKEDGCLPCLLLRIHGCTSYFPCQPEVRKDRESVYLTPLEKPE